MNNELLQKAIFEFSKKKTTNSAYYEDNWAERKERKANIRDKDLKRGYNEH